MHEDDVPLQQLLAAFAEAHRQTGCSPVQFADRQVPPDLRERFLELARVELLLQGRGDTTLVSPALPESMKANIPSYEHDFELDLDHPLGAGGMGVVFPAWQLSLNRPVAVKVLRVFKGDKDKQGNDIFDLHRQCLLDEAKTMAGMSHPNIPQVYAINEDAEAPFYAMQLVEGTTLADVLAEMAKQPATGAKDFHWAARAAHQVADALDHAHQQGVIHHDVKPKNVLIDKAGTAYLTDFGLANTNGGTVGYRAPERIGATDQPPTPQADIYSLSVTLFSMVVPTFEITKDFPAPPSARQFNPAVPEDLDAIIRKGAAIRPGDRYADFKTFTRDLDLFLHGQVPDARPGGRVRAGRAVQQNARYFATLGMAVLIVLLTAVAVAVWYGMEQKKTATLLQNSTSLLELSNPWLPKTTPQGESEPVAGSNDANRVAKIEKLTKLLAWLDSHPSGQAGRRLRAVAAKTLYSEGARKAAQAAFDRNVAEWRGAEGEWHEEMLRAVVLANSLASQDDEGRRDNALGELERAVQAMRTHPKFGPDQRETYLAVAALAGGYRAKGRYAEAMTRYDEAVGGLERVCGPKHFDTLVQKVFRAACVRSAVRTEPDGEKKKRLRNAAGELESVVADLRTSQGRLHPETLRAVNILAGVYGELGERDRAEPLYREHLDGLRVSLGPTNPFTLEACVPYGNALLKLGRPDDAIPYLKEANDGLSALPDWKGKQAQVEAATKLGLAYCRSRDKQNAGVSLLRAAVPPALELRKDDPARRAELLTDVVQEFLNVKEYEDAAKYAAIMIDARKALTDNEWKVAIDRGQLGAALLGLKKYDAAVDELQAAEAVLAAAPAKARSLPNVYSALIEAETARGNPDAAAHWKVRRDKLVVK